MRICVRVLFSGKFRIVSNPWQDGSYLRFSAVVRRLKGRLGIIRAFHVIILSNQS